jgi:uncharacterized protein
MKIKADIESSRIKNSSIEKEIIQKSNYIKGYFDPLFEWAISSISESELSLKSIAKDNIIKDLALIH